MDLDQAVDEIRYAMAAPACGSFTSVFTDGSQGELGQFVWVDRQRWSVNIDGGSRITSAPQGSLVERGGPREFGPPHSLPARAPWSLLTPSLAGILGLADDGWKPVSITPRQESTLLSVECVDVETGEFSSSALFDRQKRTIIEMQTPSWHAHLTPKVEGQESFERLESILAAIPIWHRSRV